MNGQLLSDRYKIINVLGAGGMGQTYVAEDTQRPGNPKCVVKQLKPANSDPNFLTTARRLFMGEAEMLEKLGKHDQIPQLLAHFERDEEFYLVKEFIDGQPLSAELPLGQRWSEPQVVALLKDVLGILEFIHAQGVIHRDIKPDNLIRRKQDGKLVLIDFGAVKQVRMQQATAMGQISVTVGIGTPGYMPTEQSSGKPRPSSDIYALGMVAIQALTGLLPSQLREDEDGEAIWREQAQVSDGLATVLTTMIRHYFKHRYQSASEVLQALKDLESPNLVANMGYTPTQAANNSGYTPTGLAPDRRTATQASFSGQTDSSESENGQDLEHNKDGGNAVHQQTIHPVQEEHNKQALKQQTRSNDNLKSLSRNIESNHSKSKMAVAIAASSFFVLLVGSLLIFGRPPSSKNGSTDNEVVTYAVGALEITGNRQHVCNVLLPRGPGIGGSFFYPEEEALWQDLRCKELYCDLNSASCRTSLKSQWANPERSSNDTQPSVQLSNNTELPIVDQIIQFPDKSLPEQSYEVKLLTSDQIKALNDLFNKFSQVDNSFEPAKPGSATTYEEWKALCIGEQGQPGCPKSAKHELGSYGDFSLGSRLWTSRGWVLYKP